MITITSGRALSKEVYRLSRTLKCGESVKLRLSNYSLLALLPKLTLKHELSLIDVREVGNGEVVVTIVNRLSSKCLEGSEGGSG